jgi:hypothetical protein
MEIIIGRWKLKTIKHGFWPFEWFTEEDICFEERIEPCAQL